MGLLLSTALVTGSVQAVLDIVLLLLGDESGAVITGNQPLTLPGHSLQALLRIAQAMPEHEIELQPKKVCAALSVHRLDTERLLTSQTALCAFLPAVRPGRLQDHRVAAPAARRADRAGHDPVTRCCSL
jgi:hypothetical protein